MLSHTLTHGLSRGEDYHDENNTALSQHRVKTQVVKHAQRYADANVILIDEAQKMADGVIDGMLCCAVSCRVVTWLCPIAPLTPALPPCPMLQFSSRHWSMSHLT